MPSKLTTGEIIGTTLGVLSVIMPLAIFFISHILQARKKARGPHTDLGLAMIKKATKRMLSHHRYLVAAETYFTFAKPT
ncbi:hypothetical protein DFP73DRAFT_601524 [Morchella snyderi]|nr:hypothetical protein DFP73DRAFT_601524 [Morchella snyderi]